LFAASGYNVAINFSSNQQRADTLVEELSERSPTSKFIAVKADVSKRDEVIDLVVQTVKEMGQLDVVFSNHGWTEIRGLDSLDRNMIETDWDRCFNMNVKSHLWLMHAARPHLDIQEGAFITTASLAGVKASGSSLAYSVTKAAQIHLVKNLAAMTSPKIRVNSVSPGLLLTDWGMKFSQESRDAHVERTKLKKCPSVEDVAEQVLCYARSRTVTGQNAVIDAGHSL